VAVGVVRASKDKERHKKRRDRHAHLCRRTQELALDDEAEDNGGELGEEDDVEDYLVPLARVSLRTSTRIKLENDSQGGFTP